MNLHRLGPVAVLAMLTALVACDKSGSAGADGGAATTTTTAAAAGKKPKTTLTFKDMHATWDKTMNGSGATPLPAKVATLVAKWGPPAQDNGRHKHWYAMDAAGTGCTDMDLDTTDGSLSDQTTDKANCGM